jgi:hypothetical protein
MNAILISMSFSQSIWSEPVMLNFDGLSAISPSINRTNDTLFFSRDAKIYYTVWQDTGWSKGKKLEAVFNEVYETIIENVYISPDSRRLYFSMWRGDYWGWDLVFSERTENGWSSPVPLDTNVNTDGHEWNCCLSADMQQLYFCSLRWMGKGYMDLFVSNWQDTCWGPAQLLPFGPDSINWGSDEDGVCLSQNGKELFFSAFREHGWGCDIYKSVKDSTGRWGKIEKLPFCKMQDSTDWLGNTGVDMFPSLTIDGNTLYFNREHPISKYRFIWITKKISETIDPVINSTAPKCYELYQNFPNPFNTETIIKYDVSATSRIKISVFDLSGREIVKLVDKHHSPGTYQVIWYGIDRKGRKLSSGVYSYVLSSNKITLSKKFTIIK